MNDSFCVLFFRSSDRSKGTQDPIVTVIATGIVVGIFALVGFGAFALVVVLKLNKKLTYRLVLYQIVSSVILLIFWMLDLAAKLKLFSTPAAKGIEIGAIFFASVQELLSTWIIVHLIALALCQKNLNRLEWLYMATSVAIPSIMAAVSLALVFTDRTKCSDRCPFDTMQIIEEAIACLLTVFNVTSASAIVLSLCCRACRRRNGRRPVSHHQHKKALCVMLPLLIYPLLSVCNPAFSALTNCVERHGYNPLVIIPAITIIWSTVFEFSVLLHLSVVMYIRRKRALNASSPPLIVA